MYEEKDRECLCARNEHSLCSVLEARMRMLMSALADLGDGVKRRLG